MSLILYYQQIFAIILLINFRLNFCEDPSESTITEQPKQLIDVNSNKKLPTNIFDKLSTISTTTTWLLRPISEKLTKLHNFLDYVNHPNNGGASLLHPIVNKFNHNNYLQSPLGAIYGLNHKDKIDYPFAYKK